MAAEAATAFRLGCPFLLLLILNPYYSVNLQDEH